MNENKCYCLVHMILVHAIPSTSACNKMSMRWEKLCPVRYSQLQSCMLITCILFFTGDLRDFFFNINFDYNLTFSYMLTLKPC